MENIIQHLQENTDTEIEHYTLHDPDEDSDYFEPSDQDDVHPNSNYTYIINTILNATARLKVHLPTATILVFTVFAPLITTDGKCTALGKCLTIGFVAFLSASCFIFSITDSFRTSTGRVYYGVATFRGIWTFGGGRDRRQRVGSDYSLRWSDVFRDGLLSSIVFLAFALVHDDVVECYQLELPRKLMNLAPLVVGFVISLVFGLFPFTRRGVGYPFFVAK